MMYVIYDKDTKNNEPLLIVEVDPVITGITLEDIIGDVWQIENYNLDDLCEALAKDDSGYIKNIYEVNNYLPF